MNNHIYKQKSIKVEAFKLKSNAILPNWIIKNRQIEEISFDGMDLVEVKIRTWLGYEIARQGDYIIRENDYIYACPGATFKEKYQKVEA